MKALTHRFTRIWSALLLGLVGCSSATGSSTENQRSLGEPIIGGHLDTTTNGVVALAFKSTSGQPHASAAAAQLVVFCSGSLLAPNLVLTARHCIAQIGDGTSEDVTCGTSTFTAKYDQRQIFVSTDAQPEKSGSQSYSVKEIREAPGSDQVCGYDVALLILNGAGVPSSVATPIEPVLDTATRPSVTFSAVGYGLQDPNDTAGTTAGTRQRFDTSSVYCVGSSCPASASTEADEFVGQSPVCSGDSGGPALDAQGRVFGVTSRGDKACTYALYSDVTYWATFVRSAALDAAAAAGYTPAAWATSNTQVHPGIGGASNSGTTGDGSAGEDSSSTGGAAALPAPGQSITPTVDPLGDSCVTTSDCPGTYKCYSATGQPPGTCVPSCSATNTTCPKDYTCAVKSEVCAPTAKHLSASCSLRGQPGPAHGGAYAALLGIAVTWLGRRRRRFG